MINYLDKIGAGQKCHYCKRTLLNHKPHMDHEAKFLAATVDHKVPKALGGTNTSDNYLACCYRCNQLKGHVPYSVFKTYADMALIPYPDLPLHILRNSFNLYLMHLLDMSCKNTKTMRDASTLAMLKLKDEIDDFEKSRKRKAKKCLDGTKRKL